MNGFQNNIKFDHCSISNEVCVSQPSMNWRYTCCDIYYNCTMVINLSNNCFIITLLMFLSFRYRINDFIYGLINALIKLLCSNCMVMQSTTQLEILKYLIS